MALPPPTPYLLTEVRQETPDTKTYIIKPQTGGEVIPYKPGQFLNLYLTPESDNKMMRSYSIASTPTTRDHIELGIKIQGTFPQSLKDLQPGHVFGVRGPLGHFYFDPETMPHLVLLGAGVGVTPLMGMLRFATTKGLSNKITFLDVNKTVEDTIYHQELNELHMVKNPHLKMVFSYTRLTPEDPWTGERGRLGIDMVKRHISDLNDAHYFICGPDQMNKDLKIALLEAGIPRERVKLENMGF